MKMTGGQALAHQLAREGITDVFGVPGVQLDWAMDGLRQVRDRIRFTVNRHEQASSYMADGYARSTGRVGTCMVVPGPGVLNAMAGLSTAYACNSRVLCIAGNIHSSGIGKGRGLLHEVNDQSMILGTVTKWHGAAHTPREIPGVVREAVRQILGGRPRPAAIEIAHDVLSTTAEVELIDPPTDEDGRTRPDPEEIRDAAAVLAKAKFPVIYAGGGVVAARAAAELARLAERLQAPIVCSDHGRGAISDRHSMALNTLGGRAVFPHADVVLVVGGRFVDLNQGAPAWPADGKTFIYLNADPADWSAPRRCDHAIRADAALGLAALADELPAAATDRSGDIDKVRAWAETQAREMGILYDYTKALRAGIPDDGIFVMDLTVVGYFARLMYPAYEPYTFITPGYQGTLGHAYGTGLGAAAGNPGRAVVSVIGDGGFGWNLPELATARRYNLGLVAVVFDDGGYGNVRTMMKDQFGESYGAELLNPKYDRLAEAYEMPYAAPQSPTELTAALRTAIERGGPTLIVVKLGTLPSPWKLFRLRAPFGKSTAGAPPNPLGEPGGP